MTPQEFIAKWQRANLSERSAAQQHFLDLCDLLGQPKPAAADPDGAWYTFERGVHRTDGGDGWADVWMRGRFAWEYKRKRRSLAEAYQQLLLYREDLDNPPLLVVCDLDRFEVHTNFTGTAKQVHAFDLSGLAEPAHLAILRHVFTNPEALRPGQTTEAITQDVAERFGRLADGMRDRRIPAETAAHFLMKLMFCMFAEDIDLLPGKLFTKVLAGSRYDPPGLSRKLKRLFEAMSAGGEFGADAIKYFNGGLFADADVVELLPGEIDELVRVSDCDWSNVEPSIFGTLFERTLDPAKRSQIGAHYTSKDDILALLKPVLMAPLKREWEEVKSRCDELWPKVQEAARANGAARRRKESRPRQEHDKLLRDFGDRLAGVTVLDPACGSGNFLYVAIHLLLDLEKEVIAYGSQRGLSWLPQVHPGQLAGLEINPYAQQLAQVVIWIGYLQWLHHNGFKAPSDPVLEPIENIKLMDAILDLTDPDKPKEPEWPEAEFVVGNPPFLGGNRVRAGLGDAYVDTLFSTYKDRVPPFADLCCYWFEKARCQIVKGKLQRAGLLATQGIRGGVNREILKDIKNTGDIFFAESDRPWILDGANVHVSMVGFDDGKERERRLDGKPVGHINSNLTGSTDTTNAKRLPENLDFCFYGSQQKADFDIEPQLALRMLHSPNPNGKPNSSVVKPSLNAAQILRRTHESFVIDFGLEEDMKQAAEYEMPFEYVKKHIHPVRQSRREIRQQRFWWLHARPSPRYRDAMKRLTRYIVTPVHSKYRVFVWMDAAHLVDHATLVLAREDDYFFGVLHSRIHEVWARAQGTQVRERESGFRYTPTTCFETFPFPEPTEAQREAIAEAARELDRLRTHWLNPPEWTREEVLEFPGSVDGPWARYITPTPPSPIKGEGEKAPSPVSGGGPKTPSPLGGGGQGGGIGTVRYPRLVPKDEDCQKLLAARTLTNLYNERPTWLDLAHRKLDEAVCVAYGWPADLSNEDILAKLLELNLQRAGK